MKELSLFLEIMSRAGYDQQEKYKRSMKDVFNEVFRPAHSKKIITKTINSWKRRFHLLKTDYSEFIFLIRQSEWDRDDPSLYNEFDYYTDSNQLETNEAWHWPLAVIDSVSGNHEKDE